MRASPELVGVNVGGTTTTVVRGDSDGTIVLREPFATEAEGAAAVLYDRIRAAIENVRTPATAAVGVAIGGPLDAHRGVVIGTPHLPFIDFPLRERLEADCGLKVVVHHDAAACALAEWRWGPDAGADGLAYLTCGTGFGVGLVLDGHIRYGSSGHSPEIGHVRYRDDGPPIWDKPGCFEGFASAKALGLLARWRDPMRFAQSTPAQIAEAAQAGDRDAVWVREQNEAAVGAACALLADLLVLDVIVLGSLARYLGEPWIERVRAVFAREALPANVAHCRLRAPIPDVQDLSGLAAAMDALVG
ncbi:MAG: ROK family protein [Candidatus Eremiobacteraeota bacterium]|nr:ROK family protein [Candidatus Eremiobacteraeota bacterium]